MLRTMIAIDTWKLEIFKQHLNDAGFQFEQSPGLVSGTLSLFVETPSLEKLEAVVVAANKAAQKSRAH